MTFITDSQDAQPDDVHHDLIIWDSRRLTGDSEHMSEHQVTSAQQQRYAELLQQIGATLIDAAPAGWRRIDVIAKLAEGVQDVGLSVIMSDLSDAEVDPPPHLTQAFAELRKVTYVQELGAWLSVRYTINPPGEFRIFYNYEHDPLWDPPIPAAVFERDLKTYPRPAERIPGWLRDRIGRAEPSTADPVRSTPLGIEGQRDLTRKIADLLVQRAPADRDQIRVMYRATGSYEEVRGHILGLDGQLREWDAPPEVAELYRQLRAGMHRDGVGTWTVASTIVEYPIRTTFDYRDETRWEQQPSRWAVLDELEMFPRTPDRVANWMITVLPNAERVAEVAGRFRRARIFDHRDSDGRPVVNRPPVPEAEVQAVLNYLNNGYVALAGRGFDPDLFDPNGARNVPAAHLTDGAWIWTASVPHYLTKHGVPPEPDLVAHIRANGFTPPLLDEETKDAAYLALTGEIPDPRPRQQAPVPPTQAGPGELSDADRRVLAIIERRVSEAGAIPQAYEILGSKEGAMCLERVGDEWQVASYERGRAHNTKRFAQLWDAGAHLLGRLTIIPSSLRAGGNDQNTRQALNDWPIQPLPGEPPLTLLHEKHIAALMPGREIIRYGQPAGNLAFADGTEFSAMSLRPEREQEGPRRYRVARALRVLSGQTVPWHEQPGGGIAYLLPKSLAEHLADGSITESNDEPAGSDPPA
jgi:hypothetical protein